MQDVAILSVSALTDKLRRQIEQTFPFVWVRGEVANCSRSAPGHIYFALKDAAALLRCVWFRGQQPAVRSGAHFDPLTGEVYESSVAGFELANGQEVLCAGRVSVYAPNGQHQLIVEHVQLAGDGAQAQAFEKLKQKLSAAGYFATDRKRPLPSNPSRVALLTSPVGAAIHDFLKLAGPRGSGSHIRLHAIPVQGSEAPGQIATAFAEVNRNNWAEVIVLIRGGGSMEDLRAFNSEEVATAVFSSRIPVIAGIGHEVDTSLADLTADVRAATPSHAAELLWASKRDLTQQVDEMALRLHQAFTVRIARLDGELQKLQKALQWYSPEGRIRRTGEEHAGLSQRLQTAMIRLLHDREWAYENSTQQLPGAVSRFLERLTHALGNMEIRLEALDPKAPLQRGYALVQGIDGQVVRSVSQADIGEPLEVMLGDGLLGVRVESTRKNANG